MTINFYDAIPAANNNPSADQPLMLLNNIAIKQILGINHVTFDTGNSSINGAHTSIQFDQSASYVPVPPVSPPELFTDIINGLPQLKYYTGDAAHSSDQYTPNAVNFSTMLLGGMIVKGGNILITGNPTVITYSALVPAINPFPATGTTLAVFLFPTNNTASTNNPYISAKSDTGFTVRNGGNTSTYNFIAIGY